MGTNGKRMDAKKFSANIVNNNPFPLHAFPKAWSPSTKGTLKADLVYFDVKSEEDFEKYRGKLKGTVVLLSEPREIKAHFTAEGTRRTESDLLKLANADLPAPTKPRSPQASKEVSKKQSDSTTRVMLKGFGMSDSAITKFLLHKRSM